jgi:hypothetical protein
MTVVFILVGMFIFSILAFVGGMFLFPEVFGVSKGRDLETPKNSDEDQK